MFPRNNYINAYTTTAPYALHDGATSLIRQPLCLLTYDSISQTFSGALGFPEFIITVFDSINTRDMNSNELIIVYACAGRYTPINCVILFLTHLGYLRGTRQTAPSRIATTELC